MKIGIEIDEREIDRILSIINKIEKEKLFNLLISLLEKNISSSDLLFMILEILERKEIVSGKRGEIILHKKIGNKIRGEIKDEILRQVKKIKKLFVTPLEVSKFYLCPRRLWLEKVVLAKQEKEERGKIWDGEAVHSAARILFQELPKYDLREIVKKVFKNYEGKLTISEHQLIEFLKSLVNFIEEERVDKIFPEKFLRSFRIGIVGVPDGIIVKGNEIFPLDIKLGAAKKLRKEHILQSIGEALLVQEFFRKDIQKSFLIYFTSNSVVELKFNHRMKRNFINYKRRIERIFASQLIPRTSKLSNFKKRVCQGCHVRKVCEQIETLRKLFR